jgi:transcriptional regulator GlxA family with amidase domain
LIKNALWIGLASLGLTTGTSAAPLLKTPDGRVHVAVAITRGATVIDFGGPWEVFDDVMVPSHEAPDARMPFELFTVGDSREPVEVSGGLKLVPDYTFADAPHADVVVVGAQKGSPALTAWLKKVRSSAQVVMSVCTGAFKLADAGLLDGKSATSHHMFLDALRKQHPSIKVVTQRRWVQADDVVFTAGGLTSGIDLALHVVELYFGPEVAGRTASFMEHESNSWQTGQADATKGE